MDPAAAGHRIQLPAPQLPDGVRDASVIASDLEILGQIHDRPWTQIAGTASRMLRDARRLQRRALARPATKRARQQRELDRARRTLITSGMLARLADTAKAGLTLTPAHVARARERCEQAMSEEPGRFAVTVENWIADLQGRARLDRR